MGLGDPGEQKLLGSCWVKVAAFYTWTSCFLQSILRIPRATCLYSVFSVHSCWVLVLVLAWFGLVFLSTTLARQRRADSDRWGPTPPFGSISQAIRFTNMRAASTPN